MEAFAILRYAPILRGFLVLMLAGAVFPLVGALLLDAILILPALMAVACARSLRGTFVWASVLGVVVAFGGFVFAILADLPVSSGVTIFGALLFAAIHLAALRRRK